MSNNPRDFRDWMVQVERQGRQLRGIPSMVTQTIEVVVDGIEKDKVRHPAAPIELTFQTAFYTDTSSRTRVRFLMDFPDVVFNTDGSAAPIQQYELWAKEETPSALELLTSAVPNVALPGATLPSLTNTAANAAIAAQEKPWTLRDTNTASFFRTDGFIPGTVWRFKARAIGINTVTPGEWSEDLVVQMLADKTPPPQPSAPKLVIQRGTITVSWDGQSVSGPMPADFKYAILAHGTASSPTFEIARFGRGGGFKVVADIDYYDPQFFRLRGVDESGNLGPWSEQGVGYTTPLVDKDVILSTIDAAKTHLINIDAGVSILPNTIITEHLVVTEEMTAAIANFLYVKADKIDVNSLAADEVFTGLLDAVLVVADMFEGKAFMGGTFTTAFGGKFQTDVEDLVGVKLTAKGLDAWSDSGVHTLEFDTATGDLSVFGGTFTGGAFRTDEQSAAGIKIDDEGFRAYGGGTRTFEIDRVTGAVVGTGQFRTGKDGNFIEMDATANGGVLRFWTGGDGAGQGRGTIWARDDATDGEKLSIAYSTLDEPSGNKLPVIVATPDEVYLRYGSRSIEVGEVGGAEQLTINAEGAAVVVYGNMDLRSGMTTYRYGAATQLAYVGQRVGAGGSPDFEIRALEGGIRLVGLLQSVATYGATTTTPANVVVTASGDLQRSSSASRYKLDQRLLEVPDAVLEIGMKDWIDKGEFERAQAFTGGRPVDEDGALAFDALNLGRIPGLIAEDLVAKGLEQYVIYGPDGDTEGVMYDRFALAQIAALIKRVKKLEAAATGSL